WASMSPRTSPSEVVPVAGAPVTPSSESGDCGSLCSYQGVDPALAPGTAPASRATSTRATTGRSRRTRRRWRVGPDDDDTGGLRSVAAGVALRLLMGNEFVHRSVFEVRTRSW